MNKCKKRPAMLAPLSGTKKAFRTHARTHARTDNYFFYFVLKQSHSASGNKQPCLPEVKFTKVYLFDVYLFYKKKKQFTISQQINN